MVSVVCEWGSDVVRSAGLPSSSGGAGGGGLPSSGGAEGGGLSSLPSAAEVALRGREMVGIQYM